MKCNEPSICQCCIDIIKYRRRRPSSYDRSGGGNCASSYGANRRQSRQVARIKTTATRLDQTAQTVHHTLTRQPAPTHGTRTAGRRVGRLRPAACASSVHQALARGRVQLPDGSPRHLGPSAQHRAGAAAALARAAATDLLRSSRRACSSINRLRIACLAAAGLDCMSAAKR